MIEDNRLRNIRDICMGRGYAALAANSVDLLYPYRGSVLFITVSLVTVTETTFDPGTSCIESSNTLSYSSQYITQCSQFNCLP